MKPLILVSYMASIALAIFIYFSHLRSLRQKKKTIGIIQAKWSSKLNLSFPMSCVRWGAIFLYLFWCVYQVVRQPEANAGHFSFMLLVILLSFAPRWNVFLGSGGIIFNMKVIRWERLSEKKVVSEGRNKYLYMKESFVSAEPEIKTKKIRLPKHVIIFFPHS